MRRDFEQILRDVAEKDDKIVIESEDQPLAVLVPATVYWQWLSNQEDYANKLRRLAEEHGMSAEEVDANEVVEEAKWWIRGQRRSQ